MEQKQQQQQHHHHHHQHPQQQEVANDVAWEWQHRPKLHILQLHENPVIDDDNYERFSWRWILVVPNDIPDTTKGLLPTISTGDVISFPQLLTGAGEWEGIRWVGSRLSEDRTAASISFPLYKAGVEYPEFTSEQVQWLQQYNVTLRMAYEDLLDTALRRNHNGGPTSLSEVLGGKDPLEDYWKNPPILRRRHQLDVDWLIPLDQCTVMETIEFPPLPSMQPPKQMGFGAVQP